MLTERSPNIYLQHQILKSSHSTPDLPDLLRHSSARFANFCNSDENKTWNHRSVKSLAPWRPSSYFASARLPPAFDTQSANKLGRLANLTSDSIKLYELEGLKVPSIYSAARNALYTRYTPAEWFQNHNTRLTDSKQACKRTEYLRGHGNRLGAETEDRVRRAQEEVAKLLGQRISDINFMRNELNDEMDSLVEEMDKLNEAKQVAEKALAESENPLHLTQECLYQREKRQSRDLVHDKPERSLLMEIDSIKNCQNRIKEVIAKATAQAGICRAVQHELELDSHDKFEALQMDSMAHQLRNSSAGIALHDGVERVEKWMSVPERWAQHTTANLKRSQAERAQSRAIREQIEQCINSTTTEMRDRWVSTNTALAHRIQETAEARNQLQVQLSRVNQEIFDVEKNMEYLKKCIADKQQPLKVAQTRLDLRLRRPNMELCRDDPHQRLVMEVAELQESVDQLIHQLAQIQSAHQDLVNMRSRLEMDLSIKSNSLFIDREKCLGLRKTFPMNPSLIAPV